MPVKEFDPNQFRAFTPAGQQNIIGAGLDASETCSLDCPACYRHKEANGYLTFDAASLLMDKLKNGGAKEIYYLGAEPTENPDLSKILRRSVEMGFQFVLVISNGMKLANEQYARQILIPGVSLLMQRHTLDSGSLAEKIQEASVGKPETLERSHQTWENAEKIFQEKGGQDKLMMQCCLTKTVMTGNNLDRVFHWARTNLKTLPIMEYVAPPSISSDGQVTWLMTYPRLTKQIVVQLERFRKIDERLSLPLLGYRDAVSPQAYNTSCTMLKEGGQITNGGIYLPCTNMGPSSTHPIQLGNLIFEPLSQVADNPIRKAFLEPNFRIKGCDEPCTGSGCWWTGLVTTGCYRLCQLNCVFNEQKMTIDDQPDLCDTCHLDQSRQSGELRCGPGTRPGLLFGDGEKVLYDAG